MEDRDIKRGDLVWINNGKQYRVTKVTKEYVWLKWTADRKEPSICLQRNYIEELNVLKF